MRKLEHDFDVIEEMEAFGGSFVKQLALLMRLADPINYGKLRRTFPEYWDEYKKRREERPNG